MTRGEEIFNQIQKQARADGRDASRQPPTADYLTRHALESFLDRLTHTDHGQNFVLKDRPDRQRHCSGQG